MFVTRSAISEPPEEWRAAWASLDRIEQLANNVVSPVDREGGNALVKAVMDSRRRMVEMLPQIGGQDGQSRSA